MNGGIHVEQLLREGMPKNSMVCVDQGGSLQSLCNDGLILVNSKEPWYEKYKRRAITKTRNAFHAVLCAPAASVDAIPRNAQDEGAGAGASDNALEAHAGAQGCGGGSTCRCGIATPAQPVRAGAGAQAKQESRSGCLAIVCVMCARAHMRAFLNYTWPHQPVHPDFYQLAVIPETKARARCCPVGA
eukprot:1160058-Pelagomonas_calceolata.AAC.3